MQYWFVIQPRSNSYRKNKLERIIYERKNYGEHQKWKFCLLNISPSSNLDTISRQPWEGSFSGSMKNLKGLFIFTILTHEKILQQSWRNPSNANINNVSMANAVMVSKITTALSVKNVRPPDKSNLLFGLKKENHPSWDKGNLQLQA